MHSFEVEIPTNNEHNSIMAIRSYTASLPLSIPQLLSPGGKYK